MPLYPGEIVCRKSQFFRVNPMDLQIIYKPSVVAGKPGLLTSINACHCSRA